MADGTERFWTDDHVLKDVVLKTSDKVDGRSCEGNLERNLVKYARSTELSDIHKVVLGEANNNNNKFCIKSDH